MGGDGHHHGPAYKVPDYKIYQIGNIPELVRVKDALAAKGLKDPWLRYVKCHDAQVTSINMPSINLTEMKPGAMIPLLALWNKGLTLLSSEASSMVSEFL